ncbi:MAG TPA: hypothetical protein VHT03_06275 [Rhizomicrobium sp.]|jgi:hypothetical protein|nr:hypothetical protein [Rhizomicrobium sp.]
MPLRIPLYPGYYPLADHHEGHLHFFSEQHTNAKPIVLCDGTSVRSPAHYTKRDAKIWRKRARRSFSC